MSIVISTNNCGLFGIDGELAYQSITDLSNFSRLTKTFGNVVMGSGTWRSLPSNMKPLPDRFNIVISNNPEIVKEVEEINQHNVICIPSIKEAFNVVDEPCFIGGAKLLTDLFSGKYASKIEKIYLTKFNDDSHPENGVYLNLPLEDYKVVGQYLSKTSSVLVYTGNKVDMNMTHLTYKRRVEKGNYEQQYLDTMKEILKLPPREGRNGLTHSTFGLQFKYDCSDGLVPAVTTKQFAWKTCIKELLWFIRGDTDNKILQEQNVHIWDGNSTREFLDSRGLTHNREGDLGPVYGFQWRHFGAKYVDCDSDYSGQGVDQLKMCVDMLKNDKYSRRIIMSAWNPPDLDKCCLPPCHLMLQWYVDSNDKLWLQFYQRSADMFLGVPFNMFSYSVFLHMMSKKTGISPGGVVHSIGDAHIYADHKDAVIEQLKNTILNQPKIKINFKDNWADYDITDFELIDYKSAGKISAPMSA